MQAAWKGVISFGLVSIPVAAYPAVRKEELKFRLVRKKDLSPVNYKRVAEADGQEVPYEQVVKAYEYEKGAFVPVSDEDFKRARAQGVQGVQILDFVAENEIDPLFFDKPYFLEPERTGAHAYALLRDAIAQSGVVGIAKVVIRSKQHLAALKPKGHLLVLELMHFENELVESSSFKAPTGVTAKGKEMELAKALIGSMVTEWEPQKYQDDYKTALKEVIEEKLKAGAKAGAKRAPAAKLPSNVVNVMEMLEKSLQGVAKGKSKPKRHKAAA